MNKRVLPDHPGVIAMPPVIYLMFILMGSAIQLFYPIGLMNLLRWDIENVLLGWIILFLGIGVMALGIREMKKANTPYNVRETPRNIVQSGVFRFSRNPLYISLNLIYFGIAIILNNVWIVSLFIPLMAVMYVGVILREERYLDQKFGKEYLDYKIRVRRWI